MAVVVGFVEEDERGVLFNSALLLHGGEIAHVHRKLYLPTYGIFQEGRFFGEGKRLALAPLCRAAIRSASLICEDLWHAELAAQLARAGAKLLVRHLREPGPHRPRRCRRGQEAWESLTRASALLNTCWVLYCNRVGWEEGTFYAGGSHIVRPGRRGAGPRAVPRRASAGRRDRPARGRPPALEPAAPRRRARRHRRARMTRPSEGRMIRRDQVASACSLHAPLADAALTGFIRDAVDTAGTQRRRASASPAASTRRSPRPSPSARSAPERVHAFLLPYRTSSPDSAGDARRSPRSSASPLRTIDISPMVDAYFDAEPDADPVRRGNKMARERMTILFDQAKKTRRAGARHLEQDRDPARLLDRLRRQRQLAQPARRPLQAAGLAARASTSACPRR